MKTLKFKQFTSINEGKIESEARLSDKILNILNLQIKNELESSQVYRSMSCWLDDKGWNNTSKYFFRSADEELVHMNKIYQYIFDRNCKAIVPTCEKVEDKFKDIKDVAEKSLQHEMNVTKQWENISKIAKTEDDNTTFEFAQWFLKEQIEEENKFRNILDKINLDIPNWKIDELFV